MRRKILIAALCCLNLACLTLVTPASADVFDGLDTSFATGGVFGTVTETQDDGSLRTFRIGGIPFATMLNRDISEHLSGHLQYQLLLDVINQQMLRQGVAGTVNYHILGGARRISRLGEMMSTVSTSTYNLSVAMRAGIFNFAAADRNNPSVNLSGGVWELAAGLEFRRSFSEKNATGIIMMQTLVTLPASVERLATRTTELLAFWRVYL